MLLATGWSLGTGKRQESLNLALLVLEAHGVPNPICLRIRSWGFESLRARELVEGIVPLQRASPCRRDCFDVEQLSAVVSNASATATQRSRRSC
jgi:hypothetical protein